MKKGEIIKNFPFFSDFYYFLVLFSKNIHKSETYNIFITFARQKKNASPGDE